MLTTCVRFIDGSKIGIARPSGHVHQRVVYIVQKRVRCLSYETISTPGGLIPHLYGPIARRQPDGFFHRASVLDSTL